MQDGELARHLLVIVVARLGLEVVQELRQVRRQTRGYHGCKVGVGLEASAEEVMIFRPSPTESTDGDHHPPTRDEPPSGTAR